jgi:hypothetical protein
MFTPDGSFLWIPLFVTSTTPMSTVTAALGYLAGHMQVAWKVGTLTSPRYVLPGTSLSTSLGQASNATDSVCLPRERPHKCIAQQRACPQKQEEKDEEQNPIIFPQGDPRGVLRSHIPSTLHCRSRFSSGLVQAPPCAATLTFHITSAVIINAQWS